MKWFSIWKTLEKVEQDNIGRDMRVNIGEFSKKGIGAKAGEKESVAAAPSRDISVQVR